MRVLVTGGHGFVGGHLVEALLARGDVVDCLSRRPGTPARLADLPVRMVLGDLGAVDGEGRGLDAAVAGVEEVWHLGALTRASTRREMLRVNTAGTLALARAAVRAGVRRFVFCSSLAAVGPSIDGVPLGEEAPLRPRTTYGESKRLAEVGLERLGTQAGLEWVTLRPPGVYGPHDRDFLSLFKAAAGGLVPVVGGAQRRLSLIHVRDLADGMLAAGRAAGTAGRAWFVTHEVSLSQGELLDAVARVVGRRVRRLVLPTSAARLLGGLMDLMAQLTGATPLLTRERAREVAEGHWVCTSRALSAATDWRAAIDLEVGLAESARWYRARGWL